MVTRGAPPGVPPAGQVAGAAAGATMALPREILARAPERPAVTMVDMLCTDEGSDIEFEPQRLNVAARTPDL